MTSAAGLERRPLGRTGLSVPSLCLGTMMYGDQINQADAFAQMDACLDRGIDFFDTAELYTIPPQAETQGNSETIIGNWLRERYNRDKIMIASKVAGRSKFLPWLREGQETRHTRSQIEAAVNHSLKRLQTDYLDLYQLHWPDRKTQLWGTNTTGYKHLEGDEIAIEVILDVFADLAKAGKVRHFGLSNETPYGTMKFIEAAGQKKLPRVASIQNCYNLANRHFEYGLAEITLREQVSLLAYSPIGQGALTGKYLDGANPEGSRGEMFGRLDRYETPSAEAAIGAYVKIAHDFGIDPAALALQFVTTRPWVTSNIFGARNMEQLDVAFASLEIQWTEDLNTAVNAIHAQYPNICP